MIMLRTILIFFISWMMACSPKVYQWTVDSQEEWEASLERSKNLEIENGHLQAIRDTAYFSSVFKESGKRQRLQGVRVSQSPQWNNWQAVPKLTPPMAVDAPVFIPVSNGNYWLLSKYQGDHEHGYHAWHSRDMKSWTHHGPVTSHENRWVTTAEYLDGKFYIYFDKPNDEDPHLVIDEDLADGKQGEVVGKVFDDPSHGSDIAMFRDEDGTFHLIYEDWSPVDPQKHSWDSPLAGHADSPDGIMGFVPHEYSPPIDERTKSTGEMRAYKPHPNQLVHGPDPTPYQYEVHEGPQDAFGDYAMIKVGRQYYIFCDYDPHEEGKSMRVGRWRSEDIAQRFVWDGEVGAGFHPDPTVGFAEGQFYLLVQRNDQDFISEGPWVNGVEVRAGVDTDHDGKVDQWTAFTRIQETYTQREGFARIVDTSPAVLDTHELPAGFSFKLEFRCFSHQGTYPVIDGFEAVFQN